MQKCYGMLNAYGKIFIVTKTKGSYWYGKGKIRKLLRKTAPFLFSYEDVTLSRERLENSSNFWQERLFVRDFVSILKLSGFHNLTIRPVIIRPPIFMRGKSEIPIIPPYLEKQILRIFQIVNKWFSDNPSLTVLAESYLIVGEKK